MFEMLHRFGDDVCGGVMNARFVVTPSRAGGSAIFRGTGFGLTQRVVSASCVPVFLLLLALGASSARANDEAPTISVAKLKERGRLELLAGHRERALALLWRAYEIRRRDPGVQFLLARAIEPRAKVRVLEGHVSGVSGVAFAWASVVTAGVDGTVRVWPLEGHEGPVMEAAFGPNGRLVATASLDRTGRLWDLAPEEREPSTLAGMIREMTHWVVDESGALVMREGRSE